MKIVNRSYRQLLVMLTLAMFGQVTLLSPNVNAAPAFESKSFYRLTTEWQGEGKSLDIVNDGKNNQPILAKTERVSGQSWKITKTK